MLVPGHQVPFQWPNRGRIPWFLLALALMFTSAYSATRWLGVVGAISGWIGLPQYADQIPKLSMEARWWGGLALALPFVAALVLGLCARHSPSSDRSATLSYPPEPRRWTLPMERYLVRLATSVLGTVAFIFCLLLIGFLLLKLGIHSG